MVVDFDSLKHSDLIVNEIYKGGKMPGKGSEVICKLIPGVSNSGGFRIRSEGINDYLCVLYADNKHPEWINTFNTDNGEFIYYGDNKEVNVTVTESNKRGMKFLNRINERLNKEDRSKIPPILVFVKAEEGWDVRFIGLAVPGSKKENKDFLEVVSYKQLDGTVYNYKSTYTILAIDRISREWLLDIINGNAYESKHAMDVWKRWVDNGEYVPLLKKATSFGLQNDDCELVEKENSNTVFLEGADLLDHSYNFIESNGFKYSIENITNLYLSLRSKPFVIISGISGTGKTKIVQLFAESIGATEENGQFMLVPVRPDWSDSSELLGYTDIKENFKEGQLTKLINHAIDFPECPHFLLLDEMNLARVEYYFSDILSIMESRKIEGDEFTSSKLRLTKDIEIYLPGNLYIIGTVNMDETTHPFSKKVLDRANTIEFNEIELNDFSFLKEYEKVEPIYVANESLQANYIQLQSMYEKHKELVHKVSGELAILNQHLKEIHAQVGYRVRDEICFYMAHNAEGGMLLTEDEAFDFCLMQKILPRIAGSGDRVETLLKNFKRFTEQRKLKRSDDKLKQMQERLQNDEFTSFWIA